MCIRTWFVFQTHISLFFRLEVSFRTSICVTIEVWKLQRMMPGQVIYIWSTVRDLKKVSIEKYISHSYAFESTYEGKCDDVIVRKHTIKNRCAPLTFAQKIHRSTSTGRFLCRKYAAGPKPTARGASSSSSSLPFRSAVFIASVQAPIRSRRRQRLWRWFSINTIAIIIIIHCTRTEALPLRKSHAIFLWSVNIDSAVDHKEEKVQT